jgi:hypothetical protein
VLAEQKAYFDDNGQTKFGRAGFFRAFLCQGTDVFILIHQIRIVYHLLLINRTSLYSRNTRLSIYHICAFINSQSSPLAHSLLWIIARCHYYTNRYIYTATICIACINNKTHALPLASLCAPSPYCALH